MYVVWNAVQYFIMPQCVGKLIARITLAQSFINLMKNDASVLGYK